MQPVAHINQFAISGSPERLYAATLDMIAAEEAHLRQAPATVQRKRRGVFRRLVLRPVG